MAYHNAIPPNLVNRRFLRDDFPVTFETAFLLAERTFQDGISSQDLHVCLLGNRTLEALVQYTYDVIFL